MKVGARIFSNTCQQCHHIDGLGAAGQYPPLAGSPWVAGTPDRAIEIVLEGLSGQATILGNDYNGQMPAVGQSLSDSDIAAVLTYVRGSFGNTASAVDEQEVTQIRASLGTRSPMSPDEEMKRHPLGQPDNTVAAKPAAGNVTAGSAAPAGNVTAGNLPAANLPAANLPTAAK
jgi:cytochrome c553